MTIQPLIEVLTQIYDSQVELLEMAGKKKDVIIQDRTDELSKFTNREAKIVKRLTDLEAKRTETILDYLRELGVKPDPAITLSELSNRVVSAKEKSSLMALQSNLREVTDRLKELNRMNSDLIRSSLEYIEFTLDLLSANDTDNMTYHNPSGSKSGYKPSGVFDKKG